jgi:phosphoribosylformimino-5-aminoimidazole carboxamide ribotide isomerase
MFTVIPAIDLLDGQVVRLTQGDYNQVSHYAYTPAELAKKYESFGAKRIHIVDLNGAKDGKLVNQEAIESIRSAVACELELGGGIRNKETAAHILSLGIDYLVLGSLLVKDFKAATDIISAFPDKVIAGLDFKNGELAVEGWLETSDVSLTTLLSQLEALPVNSIISTEISKDGMMSGPDLTGLTRLSKQTKLPVIASGGVSSPSDIDSLKDLQNDGIIGCIVGKAVLSGDIELSSLWRGN